MINKTQLNKLRTLIDKNKVFIENSIRKDESNEKKYSMGLSMSILMEYQKLNQNTSFDFLTDGGGDNKIDAFYFTDDESDLSELTIIQSKYKLKDGDTSTFSEDEIKLCISSCKKFLNGENFQTTNDALLKKMSDYRNLLKENDFPPVTIKLFFATNGIIHDGHKKLNEVLECYESNIFPVFVDATQFGFTQTIDSGDLMINLKDDNDKTDSIFQIDDELFSGRVASCSIYELMKFYQNSGERLLLNKNVRFLIKNSTVNKEIKQSFIDDPIRFCFLNNGITIICNDYSINHTGHPSNKVSMTKPSIVNGGQTIATLYYLYLAKYEEYRDQFEKAKIIVRFYKSPIEYSIKIAKATNSQNPISNVDLKANDNAQEFAKNYLAKYGVGLITKLGEEITFFDDIITNEFLLQIFASLYYDDPAKAKTSKASIFKKYYDLVFNTSINEEICQKLYRCYEVSKYIFNQNKKDKVILQNALYSIIYAMKLYNKNILNEKIPSEQIIQHFNSSFESSYTLMEKIIQQKQTELKTKFSMNNLFKGNEIKDLIDLEFEEKI
ncbi:MAG: AIPR family protein [Sphingobacteriales bacterium]|nr:AIPR family protein [Sphingobacteriales bacterium]